MGIIFSRVRKKKSTIETLEKLDKDIKKIEENRLNAQRKYKRITKLLLVWFVGLYVLCGITFYIQFTSILQEKLRLVPLAVSPLLLYIVKQIISWYYGRLINKNQIRLTEMKKEKKRILDEVMDKETYKVAKEILEKFSVENVPKPNNKAAVVNRIDQELRRRMVTTTTNTPGPQFFSNWPTAGNQACRPPSTPPPTRTKPALPTPMPQLMAPILPLHRSYVDKVVEYLIGDGPNNRYALICSQCHSHNGMALKEEFEYIAFKCCYCFFYNPARKLRPEAPKLDSPGKPTQKSDSDSEITSGESSDGERELDEKVLSGAENLYISYENIVDSEPPEPSTVEANKKEDTNTVNEDYKEELSTTACEENAVEKAEQKSEEEHISSNQPESDANCDQSSAKS